MGKLLLCELRRLSSYYSFNSVGDVQASQLTPHLFQGAISEADPPNNDLHIHYSHLCSYKFAEGNHSNFTAVE